MGNQKPISEEGKKATVSLMFDSIAHSYDFLNHFLSFGVDRIWRKKAVRIISQTYRNPRMIDVAAGTADLSIAAMRLDPEHITGIDISTKMLEIGRQKISRRGFNDRIELIGGDSESIPFDDNSFDVAMVAFGVRNFADPMKGLSEMRRVVRHEGMVLVLEFSKPVKFPFRQVYHFYFLHILPLVGRFFSKNAGAYRYLPESVMKFPDNEDFIELMKNAGLSEIKQHKLSGGIASIYTGLKY
jgi:demethylmenaquinone methyltransferase / 2-methoxy-6-polyprenyl-1,4-benzoquinol methylase